MPLGNPIRKQNESRMVSVLATEGQTVFTVQGGYIINHLSVFRNGVRLSPAEDFTAGDGSTVTLNNAANIDDRIDFHIFDRFTVQNAIVGAASTQTINGDLVLNGKLFGALDVPSINLTGIVTATELDLNGKGDISGDLNVVGVTTVGKQVHVGTGVSIAAGGLNVTAGISTFQAVQGTTGTFSGAVSGTTGTFSGAVSGTTGAFTGNITITNTAPQISLVDTDNNSDFSIYGSGGIFNIYDETNSASRLLIASDGTVTVVQGLVCSSTLTIPDSIIHSGDTNTKIRFPAADTISAETAGVERLRVDDNGRLLIGHSSSVHSTSLQVLGATGNTSSISLSRFSNSAASPLVVFNKSRNASVGSNTVVQNNDTIGIIRWSGADGTDYSQVADIQGQIDGAPGDNDTPGRLIFGTTADGAQYTTERMRITSAGRVGINETSPDTKLHIRNDNTAAAKIGGRRWLLPTIWRLVNLQPVVHQDLMQLVVVHLCCSR